MNRRGFLSLLGLGAAGFVVDPERLLWVPGKVTTFDLGGWSTAEASTTFTGGNTLLTADWITREALRILGAKITFVQAINRHYDDDFVQTGVSWR